MGDDFHWNAGLGHEQSVVRHCLADGLSLIADIRLPAFERRFRAMETLAGADFPKMTLEQQDALWNQVKRAERTTQARSHLD